MKEFLKNFLDKYAEKFAYESEVTGEDENTGLIITQYGRIGFDITLEDNRLVLRKVEPLDDNNDDQISSLIKIKKHFTAALKKEIEAQHDEEADEENNESEESTEDEKPANVKKSPKAASKPASKNDPEDAPVESDGVSEEEDNDEVDSLGRKCPELSNKPPAHFTKPATKKAASKQPEPAAPEEPPVPGTKAYGDAKRAKEAAAAAEAATKKETPVPPKPSVPLKPATTLKSGSAVKAPVNNAKPATEPVSAPVPTAKPPVVQSGDLVIADAAREMAYIKILISSPAGGGKTMGALLMAYGLTGDWSKILIIDTENKSGSLYVGAEVDGVKIGKYKTIQLAAPYAVERYFRAIEMAEKAGMQCLIIDSLSHAWTAEGGLLDLHTKLTAASRSGNSYTAWKDVTPLHARLIEKIMSCKMHVIISARSKTEYVLTQGEKGGMAPKKVGMGIVFRDGIEYEVSIAFEVDQASHVAQVTKDRTTIFKDTPFFKITPESGQTIVEWLNSNTVEE